ncbi:cupredoxin domain-containing protein [cf. Phormidesmis sp. LEGE 11477]|uniref:cupredoxin domain-containing protein n=1 Tax=cf. Phormidesmis sp. LEGE 11477 TaxID=1828680 RepID=UPI00187F1F97|nr:cupredoxin domain-containing protein [cf. Phormidesmis sp. LEGE 11477]MBE9060293.1 cupredoxin domain-containing protein [cf. Phormidesmis sp. LEGE 11477]
MNKQFRKNKKWLLSGLLSASLLLAPQAAKSQTSQPGTGEFRRIEQPVVLKVGVAAAGLGLIGLELWWFLLSKTKAQAATASEGVQSVDITVDGGYTPDQIVVRAGQLVKLNFLRKDPSSCLEQIVLPDFNKAIDLPLNQKATVEVLPEKAGSYTFHCGMNMFRGTMTAEEATSQAREAT